MAIYVVETSWHEDVDSFFPYEGRVRVMLRSNDANTSDWDDFSEVVDSLFFWCTNTYPTHKFDYDRAYIHVVDIWFEYMADAMHFRLTHG